MTQIALSLFALFSCLAPAQTNALREGVNAANPQAQIPPDMVAKWKKECDAKNYNSCFNLGVLHAQNMNDEAGAIPYLSKACDGGSGLGCFNLGGLLLKQDGKRPEALAHFKKACVMAKSEKQKDAQEALRDACRVARIIDKHPKTPYLELVKKLYPNS